MKTKVTKDYTITSELDILDSDVKKIDKIISAKPTVLTKPFFVDFGKEEWYYEVKTNGKCVVSKDYNTINLNGNVKRNIEKFVIKFN